MNLAERARRIAAVDPLPFFTRIILDYEVHDFLRGITRWQIFKLLFQPQKCFLITSVAKCLLEDLEHRGMPMECKWARVLVGAFPLMSSSRFKIRPEAENDYWMVRWIILRDLEAIRNIYLVTLRCGQKEQEIQQYLAHLVRIHGNQRKSRLNFRFDINLAVIGLPLHQLQRIVNDL